jgi:spore germination protein
MKKVLLVCMSMLMVSGCGRTQIIDDLALLNGVGYDLNEDSEEEPLTVTATFPIITKEGMYDRETLTVTGKSSKAAREKLKHETNLQIVSGQLRVGVFGAELANKGLLPYIDTFIRDPNIGSRIKFAIGKNGARQILTIKMENEGQNATFLDQYIAKLQKESTKTNYDMYHFLRDLYDDGIDPILPVFMVEEESLKFDGIGTFKDDKLIEMLNSIDSKMLLLLRGEVESGDLDLEIEMEEGKKEEIMLSYVEMKNKVKVNSSKDNRLRVTIRFEIIGDVLEYTGKEDLSNPEIQKKVERIVSEQLNKKGTELVSRLQKMQVDSLGIGRYIRNNMKYNKWKKLDWHQAYQEMEIQLDTTVKFSSTGKWK